VAGSVRRLDYVRGEPRVSIAHKLPTTKKARAEARAISLNPEIGARGFEPPTPWSRTNQSSQSCWFFVVLVRLNSAQFASFGENCSLNCSLVYAFMGSSQLALTTNVANNDFFILPSEIFCFLE
jgi:hypothetical protein